MIHKGVARTFFLYAYSIASGTPKTGDAANIIVYKAEDMGPATQVTDTITEIDPTNMPGWYRFTTTLNGNSAAISAVSTTSGVAVTLAGAYLNTGALPAVDAGANGGIPIIGSAPLTNLDAAVSSRAPASTALSNAVWTNTKAGYLDAAISSRLAGSAYTAPDNTSIASIKTTVDWTLDAAISTRLAAASYTAPDNASIAAIKTQTDKLQFDASNYVYATGLGGGGGVQVVVQPLTASVQRTDGAGGVISGWTYARLVASWNVKDVDLSGHDLRLILFDRLNPDTAIAEYGTVAGEIAVTYTAPDSLIEVDGADGKTPNAGNYAYVLRDQTTDTVLLSGNCLIQAAPDAG